MTGMMLLSTAFWMFLSYPFTVLVTFVGTLTFTALVYLKSLLRSKSKLPKLLHYKESSLTKHILQKCQTLQTSFKPCSWIRNPHVQTILGMIPNFGSEKQFSRKYIQMKDGGVVSISEAIRFASTSQFAPTVLVVPDVTGSDRIVNSIIEEASETRLRSIVFNGRGLNGNKLTTVQLQTYGDPGDLREVVRFLKYMYPSVLLSAVGIGSGADLLMSYLGEYGSSSLLHSAVCISSTYDSETVFNEKIPKFYEIIQLTFLKAVICRYLKDFSLRLDIKSVLKTWSMNRFIENVFCKLSETANSEEYWENNNPLRDVDEISTPLLCISSLDDPLCSNDAIPLDLFTSNPNMFLVTTQYGGHAGFVDGPFTKSWIAKSSIEYIKCLLEFQAVQNGHNRQ